MALDISFFSNISTTLLFVIGVGVILLVIAILYTLDYELRRKRVMQESTLEYRYSLRFDELKRKKIEPSEFVDLAERLGREFIQEKFQVNSKVDFSQLMETFKDKGKPYVISFCQTMLELLYSGERPGLSEARTVLNSLEMMLRQEGVLILVKKIEEPVEKTNFLGDWAKIIQKSLSENKNKKDKEETKEVSQGTNSSIKKEDPNLDISNYNPAPIPKREIIPDKKERNVKEKERKEYKYIESVDSLDRIKHRVRKHEEEKKIANR